MVKTVAGSCPGGCAHYAASSWSPGAFALLAVILVIIGAVVMIGRRGRR